MKRAYFLRSRCWNRVIGAVVSRLNRIVVRSANAYLSANPIVRIIVSRVEAMYGGNRSAKPLGQRDYTRKCNTLER
ncbi:hypothetical protein [Paenibacillus taiwanensis]|uniref:hypothetical protein n=1 Tax=Paenibacillus taiwanensis TaxID=401638 RepID=UPI001FE220C9|nr:hypothetical protein [Paenibacillus taiwanensis]